jgi:hypothetical protein
MDLWQIILYSVAALLALRSLTSLMTAYRNRLRQEIIKQTPAAADQSPQGGPPPAAAKPHSPGRSNGAAA